MLWEDIISNDFAEAVEKAKGVCVVPVGCLEKHGPHSPLGTDTIIAREVVCRAAELEPVCLFPDLPFGDLSCGHPTTPCGTISLPMETEFLLLEQLCDQIGRYGFHKILIINGHGGNNAWLTAFLEQLGNKKKNYVVGVSNSAMVYSSSF